MSKILKLNLNEENSLLVHLHGATITSWIANGQEVLFVSQKSVWDEVKAIRGGIPVVFPNFGAWSQDRPQHGFARTKKWSIIAISKADDAVTVTLSLVDDEETRKLWDHKFELEYIITLKQDQLKTNFVVHNRGDSMFDFTSLLHTYFKLDNIDNAQVHGLTNFNYSDKLQNGNIFPETNDAITIRSETDRIYYETGNQHIVETGNANNRKITIKKENFPDTVVWNPWIAKSKAMSDFGDEEYKEMICVEVGYVYKRCNLNANKSISMSQELTVSN